MRPVPVFLTMPSSTVPLLVALLIFVSFSGVGTFVFIYISVRNSSHKYNMNKYLLVPYMYAFCSYMYG